MVLRAYVDDSGVGDAPPSASIMAGWVATDENWAAFSAEWQEALDMRPSIAYFKMNEAASCRGQFAHWSGHRRDERVALFFSIIERHAMMGVTCAIHNAMYKAIFQDLNKELRRLNHPYAILFLGIVSRIANWFQKAGRSDPIEFVFDRQPDQMDKIIAGWELFSRVAVREELRPLLASQPIFRNDKIDLPLQAADLHAWWTRKALEAFFKNKAPLKPIFPGRKDSLNVPNLEFYWSEDALRRTYLSLFVVDSDGKFNPDLIPYLKFNPRELPVFQHDKLPGHLACELAERAKKAN